MSTRKKTMANPISAQEVKRRGVEAIVERLGSGPVHILQHDRPVFVALDLEDYRQLVEEAVNARLQPSLVDLDQDRVRYGSARDLMDELAD